MGPDRALADLVTTADRRARYLRAGWWDASTLCRRVVDHARSAPDAVAVVDASGRHTYRHLVDDAAAVASGLADRGVGAADVVTVQLPNCYPFAVVALAVQALGAVVNPVLPNYRARELAHIVTTARPAAVVTPDRYRGCDHRELVTDVRARTGAAFTHVVVGAGGAGAGSEGEGARGDGDSAGSEDGPDSEDSPVDFASLSNGAGRSPLGPGQADLVSELIFTSGTEARPKAVMHTEQTANFSVRAAYDHLGLGPDDVVWMPSPLGHSTGFNYGLRFALYHRLPLVLQDRWDPGAALDLIRAEGCSYTLAATTFLQDLVDEAVRTGVRLDGFRCFGCGGAPVPAALVDAAERVGVRVLRLYGSTEVLVATWNGPTASPDRRRDTDGSPLAHVEVEVGPAGTGPGGELRVRGPNTCVGFFDDPERTGATFASDGWVSTGDLVTMGSDGYLTVVGRKKEIIIRGGLNVAPREIEELLTSFDEVERAAVVGLPDDRLGERLCACVVLQPGRALELPTVVERLRASGLATYKLPERLVVVAELPLTASGKVRKHEVVRQLVADLAVGS